MVGYVSLRHIKVPRLPRRGTVWDGCWSEQTALVYICVFTFIHLAQALSAGEGGNYLFILFLLYFIYLL